MTSGLRLLRDWHVHPGLNQTTDEPPADEGELGWTLVTLAVLAFIPALVALARAASECAWCAFALGFFAAPGFLRLVSLVRATPRISRPPCPGTTCSEPSGRPPICP